jgi:hypothetical protein
MADKYTDIRSALPASYVQFIETSGGWEGDLGDNLGYVVLWEPPTIQERWDGYQMSEYLGDRWFPIGSDGGGEMLCFDLPSRTDRVFYLPFIGMASEQPIPRYDSFADVATAILERV